MNYLAPDPIDIHVGKVVKERRIALGFSQKEIAAALGLTFQQVQKYEKASNRISASKLYALACVLQVPIHFFFQGLDLAAVPGFGEPPEDFEANIEAQRDQQEMRRLFARIESAPARRQLLDLARTFADMGENKPQPKG